MSVTQSYFICSHKKPSGINDILKFLAELTKCGIELFNLIKDDLSEIPAEYLDSLLAALEKEYDAKIFLQNNEANLYKSKKLVEELNSQAL